MQKGLACIDLTRIQFQYISTAVLVAWDEIQGGFLETLPYYTPIFAGSS